MRTGVIVYLLDADFPVEREPEVAAAIKRDHRADRVEIVSRGQKHYDVMDAWWKLTAQGMQRFIFMFARNGSNTGRLQTGNPRSHLRLCK